MTWGKEGVRTSITYRSFQEGAASEAEAPLDPFLIDANGSDEGPFDVDAGILVLVGATLDASSGGAVLFISFRVE